MYENVEKIRKVKDQVQKAMFKKQNVVGVGIGRKITDGQVTDELCMKIYVEEKKHPSQVSARNQIEKEVNGIKTDVVGVGMIRFQACDRKHRKRHCLTEETASEAVTQLPLAILWPEPWDVL